MKARIEKKLCKKIAEILPRKYYGDAWLDKDEPSELAYKQGSRVSGILCIGGGVDCWGEGQDGYTVLKSFIQVVDWCKPLHKPYPKGHELEHYPMPLGKRFTGKFLIECARKIAMHERHAC